MGPDIISKLLYGVPVIRREKEVHITKYNRDTGEPEKVKVNHYVFEIKNTNIEISNNTYNDYLHCIAHNGHVWFFGVILEETDSYRRADLDNLWFTLDEYPRDIKDNINNILKELGYDGEAQFIVFQNLSY